MTKHGKRLGRPWWVFQQWAVYTNTQTGRSAVRCGWQEIYNTKTKLDAESRAKVWSDETGMTTKVVPGPGHPSRRSP